MNKNEKKALISFLSIYVGSIVLLVGLFLSLYYKNELKSVSQQCSMQMKNASNEIKAHILNTYMKKQPFKPIELKNKDIKYALFDKEKKLLYSNMKNKHEVIFHKTDYQTSQYNYYIVKLNEDNIPIEYIAIQTCSQVQDINKLKLVMVIILILTSIFVAIVAYLLAKLLLKPVREKVESMDNFIKDTAHELNTPVSVLMTSVAMLKKGKDPEKMMKYIVSSSKQISQLYNDIHFSTFANVDDSIEEEFNLEDLVSHSVEYFNDISLTKNIEIESKIEVCKIKADKNKMQKIVNNLISNAIKYSHNNSKIIVSLIDGIFSVKDFGIGITQSQQKEIFKRYKRGENSEGGFGIGLDIVKRVAKEYELDIKLTSKQNAGSTFFVDLKNILVNVNKGEC
ncbi:two-component sensor histidine kinase [Malaciobacter molluscorum LMG 25693]|uniref:histidine kinase n=1 Tax=Malaciobacter molluscorum LMG 25693 TaxID=870501 RepID=A0A2G1DK58_9BACT|nr:HAMP domain-containing sensor histidine kinase [Malaciobacter molluscorum]AXX92860.1 two-component system sensor histidine kinase [Malaciobacter molluscorum LMG 25693]PHO18696.1 two-component sensor histidine kinase [Malaciobacter molluscorum LMG 25693]